MAELHRVAAVSEIPEGAGKRVEVAGKCLAVFNVGGVYHAVPDRCPHRGGPLSEGTVEDGKLTCPWHGWAFEIATGNRVGFPPGMGNIPSYRCRVEGADVMVECE